ncbi:7tm Chemosensory receptor [Popillia japonica]|uniref:7tm Chemosensory receptor n=1 Tax=Popillia japonica TaxID=7064 RepID=A0AAW1LBH9_POPJA
MKNKINVLNSKIEPTTLCESLKLTFDIGRLMGTIPLTLDLYQVQSANPERRAKHDFCFILFYLIIFLIPASYSLYKILINNNQFFIISKNVVFVEALLLCNKIPMLLHEIRNNLMLLHEIRNNLSVKYNDVEKQIQMYSIQMLHQKLEFSALGFFVINYSLLYSIVSAVATYLVIVIQFDDTKISVTVTTAT